MRQVGLAIAQRYIEAKGDFAGCEEDFCASDSTENSGDSLDGNEINSAAPFGMPSDSISGRCEATYAASLTVAVIGGAGFVGEKLVNDLSQYFRRVIAFDPRFSELVRKENVVQTNNAAFLRECHVSLIFTPRGDDVESVLCHMCKGSIVADDTHPCLSAAVRAKFKSAEITLLKAAAVNHVQQVAFYPRLPNFDRSSVPGCLLEALVVLRCGRKVLEDFDKFCKEAECLGFGPQLMTDLTEPLTDKPESHACSCKKHELQVCHSEDMIQI